MHARDWKLETILCYSMSPWRMMVATMKYNLLKFHFHRMASESMRKSKKDEDTDDDNEERYFKNPTYEGTSNKNGVPSATYETVNLSDSTKITIENEQAYAVPDKQWQVDGTYIF